SFLGYIAMKALGTERGTLLAILAGGLVSSTATTHSLARAGRGLPELHRSLAAGVLLASTVMAPRVVVIGVAVEPRLLVPLGIPMGLVALAGIATVAVLARGSRKAPPPAVQSANPFALGMAIKLALAIAVVILLSRALYQWLGDAGLLIVSTISGVTDVDAVTVSSSRLVREGASIALATGSVLVAVLSNTIAKTAYVASIAGGPMARLVALGFLLQILVGAAGLAVVVRLTAGGG
ncbi:MAG: MgtC/SapB family protein, partial [Dongiaceae bacterium]